MKAVKVSFVNLPFLQEMLFQNSTQSQSIERNLKCSSFTPSGLEQRSPNSSPEIIFYLAAEKIEWWK